MTTESKPQALALVRYPTQADWAMIESVSPTLAAAKFFKDVFKPEQAAVIALKGWELGLPLAASFEFIHIIEGKPTLSPRGALAIVRRSGELEAEKITEAAGACTVYMKRRGGAEYELTWTLDDARKAGVVKSQGAWDKYPANMLRWRCVGFVLDYLFPDLTGGLKRADEFGAELDERGEVVDASWTSAHHEPTTASAAPAPSEAATASTPGASPEPADTPTLDQLVERYGAERVIVAAEGSIPASAEEVAAVAAKLAGEPDAAN